MTTILTTWKILKRAFSNRPTVWIFLDNGEMTVEIPKTIAPNLEEFKKKVIEIRNEFNLLIEDFKNDNQCNHELNYCAVCDIVHCVKCKKEWKNTHNPDYNYVPYIGTGGTSYVDTVVPRWNNVNLKLVK